MTTYTNFDNIAGPLDLCIIATDFLENIRPIETLTIDISDHINKQNDINPIERIRYVLNYNSRIISYYENIIRNNIEKLTDDVLNKYKSLLGSFFGMIGETKEEFQYLRNAIVHTDYEIIIDNEEPLKFLQLGLNNSADVITSSIKIKLKNNRIDKIVNIMEFNTLEEYYSFIANEVTENKMIYEGFNEFVNLNTTNKTMLRSKLDKAKINGVPLTYEEKKYIINYISFMNLRYWARLDPIKRLGIIKKIIIPSRKQDYNQQLDINISPYSIAPITYSSEEKLDKLIELIKKPEYLLETYFNALLNETFLTIDFYKEIVAKNPDILTNEEFCRDINIKSVKFEPTNGTKDSLEEKNKFIKKKYLYNENELNLRIAKKQKDILLTQTTIDKIEKSRNAGYLESETADEMINEKLELQEKLNKELEELQEKVNNNKIVTNNSEFMRRLRNSVAHGRYYADYSKAIETHDITKTLIIFEDYNEEGKLVFKIKVEAKDLKRINRQIGESIREYANTYFVDEHITSVKPVRLK